jgi:hypothetical protein
MYSLWYVYIYIYIYTHTHTHTHIVDALLILSTPKQQRSAFFDTCACISCVCHNGFVVLQEVEVQHAYKEANVRTSTWVLVHTSLYTHTSMRGYVHTHAYNTHKHTPVVQKPYIHACIHTHRRPACKGLFEMLGTPLVTHTRALCGCGSHVCWELYTEPVLVYACMCDYTYISRQKYPHTSVSICAHNVYAYMNACT